MADEPAPAPLCVDLDGTLLRTDALYETVMVLLARNPLYLFLLPFWLLQGKAFLKKKIAERAHLDPALLPYDSRVLQLLHETPARPRVLCTASDAIIAKSVAAHLGCFEETLSSNGELNLSGHRKAAALVERFGNRGFDYVGNGFIDLQVWAHARGAWVVNASQGLARAAEKVTHVRATWPPPGSRVRAWLKAIRLHQWLKNILVFVPLLASHQFFDIAVIAKSVLAFVAFGLCASGTYLLNDMLDLASDRAHHSKRRRPFAAGDLPVLHGMAVAPALTLLGFAIAIFCNPLFALVLALYYLTTLAYSFRLKRIVMVDVITLAALYTIRIIGGAAAIETALSFWLLAFSMFMFLSLAMLKRYTELVAMRRDGRSHAKGRDYSVDDLSLVQSLGGACGYIAVLVACLYINSETSAELYRRPELLWLLCPMLLYWVSRAWLMAHRGKMHDDPLVFAARDRISLVLLGLAAIAAYLAI
ncbi:UbiA family prenyltransferase [Lysobacter arvi]|uniref:UbiA family prenyltransferase n=1 Tax=Lysobacter arvi TaxID=3038776 RepID=A0ABU1CF93_9GAMM|nr:UbiA family prenyltransferase [Lysobacter arvi]MDR0183630.1 UbiA family prenyltransferase [Lysobacter arvi]